MSKEASIRYALISRDEDFRERARDAIESLAPGAHLVADVPASFGSLNAEALQELHARGPQFLLLDLGADPAAALRSLRQLSEKDPSRILVVACEELNPEVLLDAMRAGASEYLPQPVSDAELVAALQRAIRKIGRPTGGPTRQIGQLYAFFGGKGGTGVTTTATNLAVQLARNSGRSVLLLDLDMELGSSPLLLGMRPRYSVVDVVRNFHRMDDDLLRSYIEVHESGLHLLAPPSRLDITDTISREQLEPVIEFLRERYDYIVVDLPRVVTGTTATVLAKADLIFLVATPDIPSIRNLKRLQPVLSRLTGERTDHYRVLLNRWRSGEDAIAMDDVKEVLGAEVFWTLHSDPDAVGHSVNTGKPIVMNGSSRYARDLTALTAALLGIKLSAGGSLLDSLLRPFRRPSAEQRAFAAGNGGSPETAGGGRHPKVEKADA
jgi:pilus assembly protein CpaE